MKPQIIHIHGGCPFDSREQYLAYIEKYYDPFHVSNNWPHSMQEIFGDQVQVLLPRMPNTDNADYEVWKIAFEKILPLLTSDKIIFTTRSLGTIFLVKWLSENEFFRGTSSPTLLLAGEGSRKPIQSLHLVACVFDGEGIEDEGMANFILDPEKLHIVTKQVGQIHLWHSTDDPVCPWHNVERYQKYFPEATLHTFHDREHFAQEEFPELLKQLKKELI